MLLLCLRKGRMEHPFSGTLKNVDLTVDLKKEKKKNSCFVLLQGKKTRLPLGINTNEFSLSMSKSMSKQAALVFDEVTS